MRLTPLMFAICTNRGDIALKLFENGCKIYSQTDTGCTALMLTCQTGGLVVALKLIESGCELDFQNTYGWTALMFGILNSQPLCDISSEIGVGVFEVFFKKKKIVGKIAFFIFFLNFQKSFFWN